MGIIFFMEPPEGFDGFNVSILQSNRLARSVQEALLVRWFTWPGRSRVEASRKRSPHYTRGFETVVNSSLWTHTSLLVKRTPASHPSPDALLVLVRQD